MSHNVLKNLSKSNCLSAVQASPEKISGQNCSASLRNFSKPSKQPFLCRNYSKGFIPILPCVLQGKTEKCWLILHANIFLQTSKGIKTKAAQKPLHPALQKRYVYRHYEARCNHRLTSSKVKYDTAEQRIFSLLVV
jgi:hypothetical protein